MSVSMHLHDCKTNERRCASASLIAEYERRNGPVTTIPPQRRSPDTRVDLVIRADVEQKTSAPEFKRRRGRPKWVERENMLELAKHHRLAAREIGRQSGVKPASRAAEYLSGRKTPHPDLARSMERVIIMMVEEAK